MASSGGFPSLRSASRAKSTIMMPFFFTMPMRRMMPMTAMTLSAMRQTLRERPGPRPAEGGVEGGGGRLGAGVDRRLHGQAHGVVVERGEDRGHLPLAEGVVERVVDVLRGDPEPRGGAAVDSHREPETAVLEVARHISE